MKTFLECQRNLEKVWNFGRNLTYSFMNYSVLMEFLTFFFCFLISCIMFDRKHIGLVLQTSTGSRGKAEIHSQHQVRRSCPFRGFRLHRTILQDLSSDWFAWGGTNQIWKVPVFAGRVKYYFRTGWVIFKSYLWHNIGHVYWELNDLSKLISFWNYLESDLFVYIYIYMYVSESKGHLNQL